MYDFKTSISDSGFSSHSLCHEISSAAILIYKIKLDQVYNPYLSECPKGTYGQDCGKNCSHNCVDGTCHTTTGECTCKVGWWGQLCDHSKYST